MRNCTIVKNGRAQYNYSFWFYLNSLKRFTLVIPRKEADIGLIGLNLRCLVKVNSNFRDGEPC